MASKRSTVTEISLDGGSGYRSGSNGVDVVLSNSLPETEASTCESLELKKAVQWSGEGEMLGACF